MLRSYIPTWARSKSPKKPLIMPKPNIIKEVQPPPNSPRPQPQPSRQNPNPSTSTSSAQTTSTKPPPVATWQTNRPNSTTLSPTTTTDPYNNPLKLLRSLNKMRYLNGVWRRGQWRNSSMRTMQRSHTPAMLWEGTDEFYTWGKLVLRTMRTFIEYKLPTWYD